MLSSNQAWQGGAAIPRFPQTILALRSPQTGAPGEQNESVAITMPETPESGDAVPPAAWPQASAPA